MYIELFAIKSASCGGRKVGRKVGGDAVEMGYSNPVVLASDAEDTKMARTVRVGIIGDYPGSHGA